MQMFISGCVFSAGIESEAGNESDIGADRHSVTGFVSRSSGCLRGGTQ